MFNCKLCKHPKIKLIEEYILAGKITYENAAQYLGVTIEEVKQHIDHSVRNDLAFLLRKVKDKLSARVKQLLDLPVSPAYERSIAAQVRALKDLVVDIAKLENKLLEAPAIQIQNIMFQQTQIMEWLSTNLCESCKKKLLEYLEAQR